MRRSERSKPGISLGFETGSLKPGNAGEEKKKPHRRTSVTYTIACQKNLMPEC